MSLSELIKTVINEYNNYDYPVGADADPKAPWNQSDDDDQDDDDKYEPEYEPDDY